MLAFGLTSCSTAHKALQSGDYDKAIAKAQKKLKGKKQKDKYIILLEEAYAKAQQDDLNRIEDLKKKGMVQNWKRIHTIYRDLDFRQSRLKPFLPLYINAEVREAEFALMDYRAEMREIETAASEYLYRSARNLLDSNNKKDAREAYRLLEEIQSMNSNYKDVSVLKNQALNKGRNYILVNIENRSGAPLPPGFERELTDLSVHNMNDKWRVFHNNEIKNIQYDYVAKVHLNQMIVSPGFLTENAYTDKKKIQDGYLYAYDEDGNPKKDSLGNVIKTPQTKTIVCTVFETAQNKTAEVRGKLKIYDNYTKQMISNTPVSGTTAFAHIYARIDGDRRALTAESKAKLQNRPIPYPGDLEMLMQAGETIKPVIVETIIDQRSLVLK